MAGTNDGRRSLTPLGGAACAVALIAGAAVLSGCNSSELETGYHYRRLGASDNERRAYYAPEYSREAALAGQQRDASDVGNMNRRRPGTSQY